MKNILTPYNQVVISHPIYSQCYYRNLEYVYRLQIRAETGIIKIFNSFQNRIIKEQFPLKFLKIKNIEEIYEKDVFLTELTHLVAKNVFPKEYLPSSQEKNAIQYVIDEICILKRNISSESSIIEKWTCPITFECFQKPVIDDHGHTFEEAAIQKQLELDTRCPINREPISFLVPNLIVQQKVEEKHMQDPIPTFSRFQKNHANLAKTHLQLAKIYAEEREYNQAIKSYNKAFQYTKNWEDYSRLPVFFESIGQYDKAILAYFYLVKYQLEDEQCSKAIQTLEHCNSKSYSTQQVECLLIHLYPYNNQAQRSLQLIENIAKKDPKQARFLCRQILKEHPELFSFYSYLSCLVDNPQEKTHILLAGAFYAFEIKNDEVTQYFCQEAEIFDDSFQSQLMSLELLRREQNFLAIKKKLIFLAEKFEKKESAKECLQIYKMLFQVERCFEYFYKVMIGYEKFYNPQKQIKWFLTCLTLCIYEGKWSEAKKISKKMVQRIDDPQCLRFYEEVAQAGFNQQMKQKDQIFRTSFDLAKNFKQQGKWIESLQTSVYSFPFLEKQLKFFIQRIQEIGPQIQYLKENHRSPSIQEDLVYFFHRLQTICREVEKRFLLAHFGAKDWKRYLGEVENAPPLPKEIEKILKSPCPFWEGYAVEETHFFIFIPQKINGSPLTLNSFKNNLTKPKLGNEIRYKKYGNYVEKEFGNIAPAAPYWILITKDVIPNSRNKNFSEQCHLLQSYNEKIGITYEVPHVLEAVVAAIMHFFKSGNYLFPAHPQESLWTCTRCQEQVNGRRWPVAVGGFSSEGIGIYDYRYYSRKGCGIAAVRQLSYK